MAAQYEADSEPRNANHSGKKRAEAKSPRTTRTSASRPAEIGLVFPETKAGKAIGSYANARLALQHSGLEFAYDKFADRATVHGQSLGEWAGGFSDNAVAVMRQAIYARYGFDPGKQHILDAALSLCLENGSDPIVQYLEGLQWDGIKRLDTWLVEYFGAENTALNRRFARKVLMAAAARALSPGCKFDFVLTLQSGEGTGKSEAVQILAGGPDYFTDQSIANLTAREQQEATAGKWFVEWAELNGLSKTAREQVKAFASRTSDRARPAYGRITKDQPRRFVIIATTNEDEFLSDPSGNRRFWPVRVGKIDKERLRVDRDQLFAEAVATLRAGESIGLEEEFWAAATQAQAERMSDDPWLDLLRDVRGSFERTADGATEERIHPSAIWHALDLPVARANTQLGQRVTECMKRLGWKRPPGVFKIGRKSARGYVRGVT